MRNAVLLALVLTGCHAASGGAGASSDGASPTASTPLPASVLAMNLPAARAGRSIPAGTPVVWVDGDRVLADGSPVGSTTAVLQAGRPQRIDGLMDLLRRTRDASASFDGVVVLAFDAVTPVDVVKSVLQTAAFSGFPNAALVARGPDGPRALDVEAVVPIPNAPPALRASLRVAVRRAAWTLVWSDTLGEAGSRTDIGSLAELGEVVRREWTAHGAQGDASDAERGRAVLHVSQDVDYAGLVAVVDALLPTLDVTLSLAADLPSVQAGALAVPDAGAGRLPPETIQRIVRQNFGGLRLCYQQGLARSPSLSGTVRVRFVIASDGSVPSASPDPASTLTDSAVVACIQARFRKLQFPVPDGGRVQVVYPLVFAPDDAANGNQAQGIAPGL